MLESLGSFEGKYEILERIGEGGQGAVYKVRHRLLDEIRVIKTMRSELMNNEDSRERFFREARIASQVRHENIAQVLDFNVDEDDGMAFLVIEYIDGVTLQEIIAGEEPPSFRLALEIAQQSLRAIALVHRTGIIHRDISPDNLMLAIDGEGNPRVKLIDLGLAKLSDAVSGLTEKGFFLGKVRYASPEQFKTQENDAVGSWSDVYSFGLVFYELLTGRYPMRGKDDMYKVMAGHLTRPPIPFSESDPDGAIPSEARHIVLQALAKKPTERFPNGEVFHDQVRLIQFDHPIGPREREEAIRLCRRPEAEADSKKPDSDQKRVSRAFPAKKPSAGTSRSEDVTESLDSDEFDTESQSTPDLDRAPPIDEREGRETRKALLGKTVVQERERDLSLSAQEGHELETLGTTAPPSIEDQPQVSESAAEPVMPVGDESADATTADRPRSRPPALPIPSDQDISEPPIVAISDRIPGRKDTSTARVNRRALLQKRGRLAGAAGVIAILVAAALLLSGVISMPGRGGDAGEAAAGAAIGTLVINASPWAEVVEVVGGDGVRADLNGAKYTPLVVALAPGSYDIVLRNTQDGEKTIRADVVAGETTSEMVPFAEIDEDQLLRSLGLIE